VTPDRFDFAVKEGRDPGLRIIRLRCDKPFKIVRVEDVSGLLNLVPEEVVAGKEWLLKARMKSALKGTILGVVKVHTDLASHPLIHIPIIGANRMKRPAGPVPHPFQKPSFPPLVAE